MKFDNYNVAWIISDIGGGQGDAEEPQVTKAAVISNETQLNVWLTLYPGDIVFFQRTRSGKQFVESQSSYELSVNGYRGGAGVHHNLSSFTLLSGCSRDTTAGDAMRAFYDQVPLDLAEEVHNWRSRFALMVREDSVGILRAYKYTHDGRYIGEERIENIRKGARPGNARSQYQGDAFGCAISFYL
jgi:hypothetical protein